MTPQRPTQAPAGYAGRRVAVIERFLGRAAVAGGPFALLGLTPEDASEDLIILQLQRRLDAVARHPESGTHEADEVRMALHAAAAQLLEHASPAASERLEVAAQSLGTTPAAIGMEHAVLTTIGMHGGWNARALSQLMMIAQTRGAMAQDVISAVERISRAPGSPAPPFKRPALAVRGGRAPLMHPAPRPLVRPSNVPLESIPRAVEVDPGAAAVKKVVFGFGAVVVLVIGVMALVAYLLAPKKPSNPSSQPATVANDNATAPGSATRNTSSAPTNSDAASTQPDPAPPTSADSRTADAAPPPPVSFAALLTDLRDATRLLAADRAKALDRFEFLHRQLAHSWVMATPDQRTAAQDAVVEFLYRVSSEPTELDRATGAIVDAAAGLAAQGPVNATTITPTLWSSGMAVRLTRERDLPSRVQLRLRQVLESPPMRSLSSDGSGFDAGAALAATSLVPRMIPATVDVDAEANIAAWRAWTSAVSRLGLSDKPRERLIILALDSLLRDGAEPTLNKASHDAISELASALSWRDSSDAREWLMRWFDSPGVSSSDLSVITQALTGGRVRAQGLDVTMVLSPNADEGTRAALRDRYREAWGLEGNGSRDIRAGAWAEAAKREITSGTIASPGGGVGASYQLGVAVRLARLNAAAEAIWRGQAAEPNPPSGDIESLLTGVARNAGPAAAAGPARMPWGGPTRTPQALSSTPGGGGSDPTSGAWGVRYLAARTNIPVRRELLASYQPSEEMIGLEASILVSEATRGSPDDLRKSARAIVVANASHAAFVNSLLNETPSMPATRDNANLVNTIAGGLGVSPKDPAWRVSARRALVERLLEIISRDGENTGLDAMSDLLAQTYAQRAAIAGTPVPVPDAGEIADAPASGAAPPEPAPDSQAPAPTAANPTPAPTARVRAVAPLEQSAAALRARLALDARERIPTGREPLSLEEIEMRRQGRARLASGRVQEFAVEQLAVCELLAYGVAAEVPGRANAVRTLLNELAASRRAATHVVEQIEACERVMLRLWLLRLEGGDA